MAAQRLRPVGHMASSSRAVEIELQRPAAGNLARFTEVVTSRISGAVKNQVDPPAAAGRRGSSNHGSTCSWASIDRSSDADDHTCPRRGRGVSRSWPIRDAHRGQPRVGKLSGCCATGPDRLSPPANGRPGMGHAGCLFVLLRSRDRSRGLPRFSGTDRLRSRTRGRLHV